MTNCNCFSIKVGFSLFKWPKSLNMQFLRYYGNKMSKVIAIHSSKCQKKLILRKKSAVSFAVTFTLLTTDTFQTFMSQFQVSVPFNFPAQRISILLCEHRKFLAMLILRFWIFIYWDNIFAVIPLSDCPESDHARLQTTERCSTVIFRRIWSSVKTDAFCMTWRKLIETGFLGAFDKKWKFEIWKNNWLK